MCQISSWPIISVPKKKKKQKSLSYLIFPSVSYTHTIIINWIIFLSSLQLFRALSKLNSIDVCELFVLLCTQHLIVVDKNHSRKLIASQFQRAYPTFYPIENIAIILSHKTMLPYYSQPIYIQVNVLLRLLSFNA